MPWTAPRATWPWAVGFESANRTDLRGFAIGQLESNSVPPYPVCEEKKCDDAATSDSSLLASDCTHLTSGDQCNDVSIAGHMGSASTLTCTLEVVNGSRSLTGGLPNCSATVCAVDGIPSGTSHDWDGIAFGEISLCTLFGLLRARRRHLFHRVLWVR